MSENVIMDDKKRDWIISNLVGRNILDISFDADLAVLGDYKTVEYCNFILNKECYIENCSTVHDLMDYDFANLKYDTIVFNKTISDQKYIGILLKKMMPIISDKGKLLFSLDLVKVKELNFDTYQGLLLNYLFLDGVLYCTFKKDISNHRIQLNKSNLNKTSYEEIKKIATLEQRNRNLNEQLRQEKIQKLEANRELYQEYEDTEKLLNNLIIMERKYNALMNSKLGKVTLKYWDMKNRKRRR